MNYQKGLMYVVLVMLLTGCASMEISTEHDTAFNFSNLKTYTWLPNPQKSARRGSGIRVSDWGKGSVWRSMNR